MAKKDILANLFESGCGYRESDFTVEQHADLFDAHHALVKCVVPKKSLFEMNVYDDPKKKLEALPHKLAKFTGGKPIRHFPGSKLLLISSNNQTKCNGGHIIENFKKQRNAATYAKMDHEESLQLDLLGARINLTFQELGILMNEAGKMDCEIDLADE